MTIASTILFTALLVLISIAFFIDHIQKNMADQNALIEMINQTLPQTQCEQCEHAGCLPYARAIASGNADINQCPPGGQSVIDALARLMGRPKKPLDTTFGITEPPKVAFVIEPWCIGCTKCIQACPVDAIVGAGKVMHTIVEDECNGCGLCLPPCPTDCIELRPLATLTKTSALA
ncbi:MAG: RnfABCDGE type electron transport complex subunit B [Gammaproteobacteria bacterium]|nr:RnfABCDGE type electron transport complex subunit B [Gammaproteobacteria bacterium]